MPSQIGIRQRLVELVEVFGAWLVNASELKSKVTTRSNASAEPAGAAPVAPALHSTSVPMHSPRAAPRSVQNA